MRLRGYLATICDQGVNRVLIGTYEIYICKSTSTICCFKEASKEAWV